MSNYDFQDRGFYLGQQMAKADIAELEAENERLKLIEARAIGEYLAMRNGIYPFGVAVITLELLQRVLGYTPKGDSNE